MNRIPLAPVKASEPDAGEDPDPDPDDWPFAAPAEHKLRLGGEVTTARELAGLPSASVPTAMMTWRVARQELLIGTFAQPEPF